MKKIFTQFFLFATLFLASVNLNAQTNNNGIWYSLYDATEREIGLNKDYTYNVFSPTTQSLTFDAKRTAAGIGSLHVAPIVDGEQLSDIYDQNPGKITKTFFGIETKVDYTDDPYAATTPVNLTQLKFYHPLGGSLSKYIKNIKLPLAKHILLADGTSFGTTSITTEFANPVNINETSSALTVKLRSFLTAGNINITSDNPAFYVATSTYAVGANACASANGAAGNMAGGNTLGNINHYDVHIYFHPTSAGAHSGTITLTDGTSTATIKVSGTCNKIAQTITWNDNIANIKTTDNITLNATATTAITYTSSDENIAEVNGSTLKINKHGKVTITATAAETDIYASASQTKEVTISATTPEVTWPQVAPITYGTPLTFDMLVGGNANVPGNFECGELPTILNAGTHKISVRFVPENQNIYAIVEGTVPVTINKAAQTITWDFTDQEITVGTTLTLNASATFGEVTFSIEDNGVASLEGNTLTAIKAGTVTITASQAGNDNYNAAPAIQNTITVIKATPIVTAWPTINNVVYGATYGEAVQLVGGEASVEGTFSIINMPADLTQVPTVGTYTFEVIFTPTKADCYNTLQNSVTLTVTKELQTITWDFADQEVLIGATLNLNATATSGEVTFAIEPAEGIAMLEGNTLTALAAGTVTITATAPENENYEAATISHIVTVIKHTPEITTLPTVDPIGYDTPLTNDLLMGGETTTEGTWEFVNPDQELQMGDNEVVIRFIPNNAEHYSPIEITIIITVEKATTTISWEKINSDDLYIGGYLGLYAEASSGVEISYTVTAPEGVLEYDSDLGVYFIIGYGTITITAHVEETETHKAAEMTQEVTLYDPDSNPSTNITNTTINGEKAQKIFFNGKLYIIRNNQWYDTTGKLVK